MKEFTRSIGKEEREKKRKERRMVMSLVLSAECYVVVTLGSNDKIFMKLNLGQCFFNESSRLTRMLLSSVMRWYCCLAYHFHVRFSSEGMLLTSRKEVKIGIVANAMSLSSDTKYDNLFTSPVYYRRFILRIERPQYCGMILSISVSFEQRGSRRWRSLVSE